MSCIVVKHWKAIMPFRVLMVMRRYEMEIVLQAQNRPLSSAMKLGCVVVVHGGGF